LVPARIVFLFDMDDIPLDHMKCIAAHAEDMPEIHTGKWGATQPLAL
jgi:hypothetical protein